jgi:MFS transporter, FHS family, glucose/mannose:H+ symporter
MTMAFTGIGSTMLGPFLPRLLVLWRLQDRQAGMLVASLFLGSFSGTLAMSDSLDRCLRRGSCTATLGCFGFAWATHSDHGFVPSLAALPVFGFGMGQLMSSLNLLVGAAPAATRARELAGLSAAWCVGAVVSPCLSTVLLRDVSPSFRLALFSPLFLLPLIALPTDQAEPSQFRLQGLVPFSNDALICTLLFLIYGGIEASISAWMPAFTTRYSGGSLIAAQWILSLFWCGLIVGRTLIAALVTPHTEALLPRAAILLSVACLVWLLLAPSFAQAAVGSTIMGICIAPLFPFLLSTTLSRGYSNRTMGIMLACCALGSALFPFLLGVLSNLFSLRVGMLVLIVGFFFLFTFRWESPTRFKS